MNERDTTELVSELATALAEALRHTKYRRVTVEITPRGGTTITCETLEGDAT